MDGGKTDGGRTKPGINLPRWLEVVRETPEGYAVRTPFRTEGDPVDLLLAVQGEKVTVCDMGAAACELFSQNQSRQGDPGYELAMALAKAHGITADREEGTLTIQTDPEGMEEALGSMIQVVITVLQATCHLPGGRG